MKLSEILKDWPEELENIWYQASGQDCYPIEDAYKDGKCVGFNKAIKYCDHEIDREALANVLYKICIMTESHSNRKVDYFISTMPQWLKRFENGKISS